jgi:hypothetical protein
MVTSMGKLQNQVNQHELIINELRKDIYTLLGVLHNHRMIRLMDDLQIKPILNTEPNPTCIDLDLTSGLCDAEGSTHYKKACAFGAWFRDCITFRGLHGELPELYTKYNKTPEQMETMNVNYHENDQK